MKDRNERSLAVLTAWKKESYIPSMVDSRVLAKLKILINAALDEQDKMTRHRCAEVVAGINADWRIKDAHDAIMNSGEEK